MSYELGVMRFKERRQSIFDRLKNKFFDKKVLVVGLGLLGGGVGLVKFFSELGAKVRVTDKKKEHQLLQSINQLKQWPVEFSLGGHQLSDFLWADIIFKGPSVPWDLPEILEAEKRGIPVEMELSFFVSYCSSKIIGITGTRGKSTTTNLIYQLLKKSGFTTHLAGRLPGISTINLLPKIKPGDFVVLELSSWDLSGFHRKKISPNISIFTSFYPDHLNYYRTMEDYLFDKKAIFLYQKPQDYLIINRSVLQYLNIKNLRSKVVVYTKSDFPSQLKYLRGDHNQENAAAALAVAKVLNLDQKKSIDMIINYPGLSFRQEIIRKINNLIFVNDSAATTPTATIKAINSFSDGKIILLLGGNSKNLPWDELMDQLIKVKKIVLLKGTFTQEILIALQKKYPKKLTPIYDNLEEAIKAAFYFGNKEKEKTYILFSPGATSFAMFNNEFHRGEEFNKIVRKL